MEGEVDLTDRYEGVIGYICAKQLPGTTPLYEYYSEKYVNHSYCTNWRGTISGTDRYQGTLGYIYTSQVPGTTPLYGYYSKSILIIVYQHIGEVLKRGVMLINVHGGMCIN